MSDVLGIKIIIPSGEEFGARGAAYLASVAIKKYTSLNQVANKNKNFHGYLAPDGWLYSAFWGDTKCFRVNPLTQEIQWEDYEYSFMDDKHTVKEGSGIMSLGTGYSTCATVKGKDVYLGLAGTSKAIKLEF